MVTSLMSFRGLRTEFLKVLSLGNGFFIFKLSNLELLVLLIEGRRTTVAYKGPEKQWRPPLSAANQVSFFQREKGVAADPGIRADDRAAARAWKRGTDPTSNQGKLASALDGSEPLATPSNSTCLSADFPEPHPQGSRPAQLRSRATTLARARLLWLGYRAKQQREPADVSTCQRRS